MHQADKEPGALAELRALLDVASSPSQWLRSADDATLDAYRLAHKTPAAAAEKLLATARWRDEYGVDDILRAWPADRSPGATLVRRHWPVGVAGRNHRGCPVLFNRFSRVDFGALQEQATLELMVRQAVYFLELVSQQARAHGDGRAATCIFDTGCDEGEESSSPASDWTTLASYMHSMLAYVGAATKVTEAHYPAIYANIFFVRSPQYFSDGWRFAASMLDEQTRNTTTLCAGVPMERLLELMPASAVPTCLGGESPLVLPVGGKLAKPDS